MNVSDSHGINGKLRAHIRSAAAAAYRITNTVKPASKGTFVYKTCVKGKNTVY